MTTFERISRKNKERCAIWHIGGINDWSPTDWACAMAGEAGEVCNAIKKLRRQEDNIRQAESSNIRQELIDDVKTEIGDTFLYLDLLAQRLGINMEQAVVDTFNRVSKREGINIWI